jgi:triacylglycerol lipase
VSHVGGNTTRTVVAKIGRDCVDDAGELLLYGPEEAHDAMHELLLVSAPFGGSPTDGMIEVKRAKWGLFRGCLPADHYDVIGQIAHTTRDPITGFDAPRFYRWLVSDLAKRGL